MESLNLIITPKQKNILGKISELSQGPDGWCAVMDLSITKTIIKMSALNRNLRQLERRGLIERRADNRSQEYVRLVGLPAGERLYDFYEMGD